jgi:hypothetical protein
MKRNLEGKEKEKESVNEAMGISDTWKDATVEFIVDEIGEKEKVSDVIESLLIDIKEEEFGEGNYQTTTYEKKLLFAGMLLEKSLSSLVNKSKGMDSLLEMLKMLGEDGPDDGPEDIQ